MRNVTFKNLTEEQINAIKALLGDVCKISEDTKKDETSSFPQLCDTYYFLYSDGTISQQSYYPNEAIDKGRLTVGNIFRTHEEAEFEVERLKVLHEMKQFAEPKDYKWDNNNDHYYIFWSFCYNELKIGSVSMVKTNEIYFKSEEDAEACIKTVGEDRIKKYYLKVKKTDISIKETKNVQLLS